MAKQPPANPAFDVESLKAILNYYLESEDDEQIVITDDTKHTQILSSTDGYSPSTSSETRYRTEVQWSLWKAGQPEVIWPADWVDLTISELAGALIELINAKTPQL